LSISDCDLQIKRMVMLFNGHLILLQAQIDALNSNTLARFWWIRYRVETDKSKRRNQKFEGELDFMSVSLAPRARRDRCRFRADRRPVGPPSGGNLRLRAHECEDLCRHLSHLPEGGPEFGFTFQLLLRSLCVPENPIRWVQDLVSPHARPLISPARVGLRQSFLTSDR
jgi:hypothetical protein